MDIIRCLALVEALIDFGEGEAIEDGVFGQGRCSVPPCKRLNRYSMGGSQGAGQCPGTGYTPSVI